mmetsp:Transcript_27032/g.35024  ORF Transcript_27032/g.35024 Transcript_27032/m.35024 type:complete len:521 (+) Transcript_27032:3-1565(+)
MVMEEFESMNHRLSSDVDDFLDLLKEQDGCKSHSHSQQDPNSKIRDLRNMGRPEKQRLILLASVVLFISQVTYCMLFPVLPAIILEIANNDAGNAALLYTSFSSLSRGLQLLAAPFLGTLSDVWGRKPVLLQSLIITGLCSFLMAYQRSFWYFLLAHLMLGLGHITKPVCYTIAADLTESDKKEDGVHRVKAFANMGVACSVALGLGPVAGAVISVVKSAEYTLLISGVLNLTAAILVVSTQFYGRQRCIKGVDLHVSHRFNFCCPRLPFKDREMGLATVSYLLAFISSTIGFGVYSIWYIYTANRYGWSTLDNGLFLSGYGLLMSLSQGPLLRWLVPNRISEDKAISSSLWINLWIFVGFGTAVNTYMVVLFLPLVIMGGFVDPLLRTKLAGLACTEDQGTLQGFLYSTSSLCTIVGGTVSSVLIAAADSTTSIELNIFGQSIPATAGAPFYFGAILFLLAICMIKYNSRYGATEFQEVANEQEALLQLKRSSSMNSSEFLYKAAKPQESKSKNETILI